MNNDKRPPARPPPIPANPVCETHRIAVLDNFVCPKCVDDNARERRWFFILALLLAFIVLILTVKGVIPNTLRP